MTAATVQVFSLKLSLNFKVTFINEITGSKLSICLSCCCSYHHFVCSCGKCICTFGSDENQHRNQQVLISRLVNCQFSNKLQGVRNMFFFQATWEQNKPSVLKSFTKADNSVFPSAVWRKTRLLFGFHQSYFIIHCHNNGRAEYFIPG